MLSRLGYPVSELEDAAYRYLVGRNSASVADVATELDCPVETAQAALARLLDHGLVGHGPGPVGSSRWSASPPDRTLGRDLARMRAELVEVEAEAQALVETYHRGRVSPAASELIEVLEGREAQARRLHQLEKGAQRSICVFQTGRNLVAPVAQTFEPEPELPPEHPITYRVVVDTSFLTEPSAVRALDERFSEGHLIRVVDQPLIKLAIIDGDIAMMQIDPDTSVTIRPPLLKLATELFESTWRRSRPYLRDGDDPEPIDRQLLQLMVSGLTDAAMANQLGTSPRTIQRRLRVMMELAEVSSRVQLGWYALRNNWV